MSETALYLPKYCILEASIRENTEIPDAAKIYFGELAVLASKYNHIPYTDEQLAEMKGVDIRTIKRWNEDLEKHGFIERETKNCLVEGEKCKWLKKRKMYINQNPNSKYVSERDKNVPSHEGDKNVPSDERDKNVPILNKIENKKENNTKPCGAVGVLSCLKDLGIAEKEKQWIMEKYGGEEQRVSDAVAFATQPDKKPSCLAAFLKWAIQERKKPERLCDPASNKKTAQELLKCLETVSDKWEVDVLNKEVEIRPIVELKKDDRGRVYDKNYGNSITIKYENKGFISMINDFLKEYVPHVYRDNWSLS